MSCFGFGKSASLRSFCPLAASSSSSSSLLRGWIHSLTYYRQDDLHYQPAGHFSSVDNHTMTMEGFEVGEVGFRFMSDVLEWRGSYASWACWATAHRLVACSLCLVGW